MDFRRPPAIGMTGRAARGAVTTGLSQAVRIAVQLASVVMLSRVLSPYDFGVVAMVTPIFAFAMMFQDLGLTQATIQRDDITHRQVSGLFWLNAGASLVLVLLMAAAAPLAAHFYKTPALAPMVTAFACLILVAGLGSQHMAILNRQLRFTTLAAIEALAAVLGFAASFAFALLQPSPWALFAGSFVTLATTTVGAWLSVRWTPGAPSGLAELRRLMGFGAGITGFNLLNYLASNLDNVLIGRFFGASALGAYDRAYKLLLMPLQQVTGPLSRIALPMLSHVQGEPERYRRAYEKLVHQMLLLLVPGVAYLVAHAELVVTTVMGAKWAQSAPLFAALGYAALLKPLNSTTGWLLISQARVRTYFWGGAFTTVVSIAAILFGLQWGALGVATAYGASEFVKTPVIWLLATRSGPVRIGHVLRLVAPHAAAALAVLALSLAPPIQVGPALVDVILGGLCAYLAAGLVILLFPAGRQALGESLNAARHLVVRKVSHG